MDFYPFNLVFAVAVAAATIFLGFLPTRNIRADFFARQVLPMVFAWVLIALASPSSVRHFHFLISFLCFASWWQFHRENGLGGKMWLSAASGLGISLGVMLILSVTPRAFPPGMTQPGQGLLLASIYLGGAVIGLAYVCHVLVLSDRSGVTRDQVQRYVGLLVGLVVMRAVLLLTLLFLTPEIPGRPTMHTYTPPETQSTMAVFGYKTTADLAYVQEGHITMQMLLALTLVILILPILAFVARRAVHSGSASRAAAALISVCCGGICAEIFCRLLLL